MTDDTAKELRNIILATQDMLNNLDSLLELICLAGAGIGDSTGEAVQRGAVLAQEELNGALACLKSSIKVCGAAI